MFFDELTPFLREMAQNPVAFLGGFAAGVFKLDLNQDPVKSWIEKQGGSVPPSDSSNTGSGGGSASSGPQSISID